MKDRLKRRKEDRFIDIKRQKDRHTEIGRVQKTPTDK